jgi:2'-hydroxyisoflavone reductase
MRLLIIGGTMFLGRHVVEAATARGHDVTLFHRGKTNPDVFPAVERIIGDRTTDLSGLAGGEWDAIIDTCGYHPRDVRASAQLLASRVGHYIFVSTISVYGELTKPGADESTPVDDSIDDPEAATVSNETYGPLKALCERAAEDALPGRVANVRPGLIVGPFDPSDRFTYWPVRVARGGEVLAPAPPDRSVQVIDGRDLADWLVTVAERRIVGVFNATGPATQLALGQVLDACNDVARSGATVTWVPTEFLAEHDVTPWIDMPLALWGGGEGLNEVDVSRAIAAGLTFRPLADTIGATLDWYASVDDRPLRAGITAEREAEVLAAWHAASG